MPIALKLQGQVVHQDAELLVHTAFSKSDPNLPVNLVIETVLGSEVVCNVPLSAAQMRMVIDVLQFTLDAMEGRIR